MSLPKVEKIVVNMGVGSATEKKHLEDAVAALTQITGQKPLVTKSRHAIAGFKLRENCRSAARSRSAAGGCTSSWTGWSAGPAARPRLSRPQPQCLRRPRQLQPGPVGTVGVSRTEPRQVHAAARNEHVHRDHNATATTKLASCLRGMGLPFKAEESQGKERRSVSGVHGCRRHCLGKAPPRLQQLTIKEPSYGKQIEDRQGTAEAQVFHAAQAALPELRAAPGGVSQVRHLPDLFPQDGRPGVDSRRAQGELVRPR